MVKQVRVFVIYFLFCLLLLVECCVCFPCLLQVVYLPFPTTVEWAVVWCVVMCCIVRWWVFEGTFDRFSFILCSFFINNTRGQSMLYLGVLWWLFILRKWWFNRTITMFLSFFLGIPYPSLGDAKVSLKRDFLDQAARVMRSFSPKLFTIVLSLCSFFA